jgi:hypothetical protein
MRLKRSLISIGILCLLSLGVLADDNDKMIKERLEFSRDITVGNTLVKKGRYLVKYNSDTGTVMFVDAEDHSKIFAKAKAEVVVREKDFDRDEILTRTEGDLVMLTGLRLGGQREELTIVGSA